MRLFGQKLGQKLLTVFAQVAPVFHMKTGRKQIHYETSDGKTIVGLNKQTDGRWRVMETGQRFRADTEKQAIAQFYKMTDKGLTLAGEKLTKISKAEAIRVAAEVGVSVDELAEVFQFTEAHFWARVEREIRTRPQYVAKMIGDERLSYLDKQKPRQALPSLDDLGQLYEEKATVKSAERNKIRAAWKEFRETTEITSLKEIDADIAVKFREAAAKRGLSGKSQSLLFNRVRRVLTFAKFHNKAPEAMDAALKALEIMSVSDVQTQAEANPISVEDWKSLYSVATGDDLAMILLGLNCGAYLQEIVDFEWTSFKDGCLVARRKKKGKHLRVAKLWAETIAALEALPKRIDHLFISENGLPLTVSGAGKRFRALRKLAKVEHVQANQLRDGASQAATEAEVEERFINMMMGWRNPGVSDKYVLRNPAMVQPACDATYAKYMK